MKTVAINKKTRVEVPAEHRENGVVAFQMVEFVISFFGNEVVSCLDTKILEDGRQVVIGGCGFIPDGYEI